MFADFGTSVTFNGAQATGILDTYTDLYMHGGGPGGQESSEIVLRIPYNAFSPMPQPRDVITVAGKNYTVKSLPTNRDAAIVELRLKPAAA